MAYKGNKMGKSEVKKIEHLENERSLFCKIKNICHSFSIFFFFMKYQACNQLRELGKKSPWFWKKIPWLCSSRDQMSHLKSFFKSIYDIKSQKFSLLGLSFECCRSNIYRSALIPRNLSYPEKFLVALLNI